ncbi:hypothetical protein Plhal304r1_c077g0164051 [Plasmopara halstedii]
MSCDMAHDGWNCTPTIFLMLKHLSQSCSFCSFFRIHQTISDVTCLIGKMSFF